MQSWPSLRSSTVRPAAVDSAGDAADAGVTGPATLLPSHAASGMKATCACFWATTGLAVIRPQTLNGQLYACAPTWYHKPPLAVLRFICAVMERQATVSPRAGIPNGLSWVEISPLLNRMDVNVSKTNSSPAPHGGEADSSSLKSKCPRVWPEHLMGRDQASYRNRGPERANA